MASKKQGYAAVAMGPKLMAAVARIAKKENRALSRQAAVLVELGLSEYERQLAEKARPA
jgi:hypothetical protein